LNKGLVLNFSHLMRLDKTKEDALGYLMGWIEL
jgi:CRISPR/Cas system CSM-associated protein Csm5 (group 7 of RAMP superfamily)